MPVRVAEVDAAILAGTPADRDPALFQYGFQRLVGPRRHVERQMIEVLSSGQRRIARVLEQGETLLSGTQEDLSLVFPVYSHPEYFSVKQLRPLHVIDVEHDVVHSARFDHWVTPGESCAVARSRRTAPAGPLSFGRVGNTDQSRRR